MSTYKDVFVNYTKGMVCIICAVIDCLSVFVFNLSGKSTYSIMFSYMMISSVFVLSCYSSWRDLKKILKGPKITSVNPLGSALTVLLSVLFAIVAFISKRFSTMLLISGASYLNTLCSGLIIIYSCYRCLNFATDMLNLSHQYKFPKKSVTLYLFVQSTEGRGKGLLHIMILCLSLLTCHYKLLSLSFSLLHLANRYGGIYNSLSKMSCFLYLPLITIAQYNAHRAANNIYTFLTQDMKFMTLLDIMWLSTIGLGSYSVAISSKLVLLGNPVAVIALNESCQHIRRGGRDFPCRKAAERFKDAHENRDKEHVL